MSKPTVCISFDYEKDKLYRYLISAWNANKNIEFSIYDKTPNEIDTNSISRVKAVLTNKIKESKGLVVISGEDINKKHKDSNEIGCKNWQNWECMKALEEEKPIILIKLRSSNQIPEELYGKVRTDIVGFNEDEIIKAINRICK